MKISWVFFGAGLFFVLGLTAQAAVDELGFELGVFHVRPEVFSEAFSDDRVTYDAGDVKGDFYGEQGASVFLKNADAQYQLSGDAAYGYRVYSEYTDLNDDFYNGSVLVATRQDPLKYGVVGRVRKTLDYDTSVDLPAGQEPGAILTSGVSIYYSAKADVSYEKRLGDRSSLVPSYSFFHYFQDFDPGGSAEWQTHQAALQLGYEIFPKTRLTLSGSGRLEKNEDEDGIISTVSMGGDGQSSEKTKWNAEVGISFADYELSGKDRSFFASGRGTWQATDKISVYVFGSSDFQPGYNGGAARQVHRLGYGGSWVPVTRWSVHLRGLHDYKEEIGRGGGDPANGKVLHFFTAQLVYNPSKHFSLALIGSYNRDEEVEDQHIASLRATFRY